MRYSLTLFLELGVGVGSATTAPRHFKNHAMRVLSPNVAWKSDIHPNFAVHLMCFFSCKISIIKINFKFQHVFWICTAWTLFRSSTNARRGFPESRWDNFCDVQFCNTQPERAFTVVKKWVSAPGKDPKEGASTATADTQGKSPNAVNRSGNDMIAILMEDLQAESLTVGIGNGNLIFCPKLAMKSRAAQLWINGYPKFLTTRSRASHRSPWAVN